MANKYKVYSVEASKWTSAMEMKFDYVKVYNGKVYFVSRKPIEGAVLVEKVPDALGGWLLDCETELVFTSNNKKALKDMEKAKQQLVTDFEAGLKKALAEFDEEQKTAEP